MSSDNEEEINNEDCEIDVIDLSNTENRDILIDKEQRLVEEHDLSSDSTDELETYIKFRKNEILSQTKEQKQKHNEQIVVATSTTGKKVVDLSANSMSSNSAIEMISNSACGIPNPTNSRCGETKSNEINTHDHYFIDASSLLDESEVCYTQTLVDEPKLSDKKLTKLKFAEETEEKEYRTAEFYKEIKVSNSIEKKIDKTFYMDKISTSKITENDMDTVGHSINNASLDFFSFDISNHDLNTPTLINNNNNVGNEENKKCNFIRSSTFELENEETMQRNCNERRQGLLVFQNSIKQFSTHNLASLPTTPHNSIIHVNDTIIINPSLEGPLDSIFFENPNKNITEVTCDLEIITCEDENYDASNSSIGNFVLKPIKRDDSVPILSYGVCSKDLELDLDQNCEEAYGTTSILEDLKSNENTSNHVIKTAWVVDMSIPQLSSKQDLADDTVNAKSNKKSLGFYIDFNDIPIEDKKQTQVTNKAEFSKKNMFSMCIDFQAPKKEIPTRLSQSLYAKKCNKQNVSDNEQNTIDSFTSDTKSIQTDNLKNSIEKNTLLRNKRSSSNTLNRHSWNTSDDFDINSPQHTYSLSATMEFSNNCIVDNNTNNLIQSEVENTLQEFNHKRQVNLPPIDDEFQKIKDCLNLHDTKAKTAGFVSLSDLDKPTTKNINIEQPVYTRMTRSIPETSWIENKLLMSRSIGCRTSTKLLTHMSSSTPSSICFSKDTFTNNSGQDSDEIVSEPSDFSSIQSSTVLEISTNEPSQSSSFQLRNSTNRLGNDLMRMFLEEISPDITVNIGDKRIKAHKCILSSRCQYFAAMLSGDWIESAGNIISLQGFSYQSVYFAMCHIYSGAADIPETINLMELATLADMLGLEGLKEIVANTLKVKYCHQFHKPCSICVVGVLECLPLSAAYGFDDLYRKALKWITRYFVRIWPTRPFALLPREIIDKCYQQHILYMSPDNIIETILCVDKLLTTFPNVRWAEVIHELVCNLAEACQAYITQHFSSLLASSSFLTLGRELNWNISKLENGLFLAAENLSPEQACRSYYRIHNLQSFLKSEDECWSVNFIQLVQNILTRVEESMVRQAVRVTHTAAWAKLDASLRSHIQELSCLPLEQPYPLRQSRSTSGSRNLDLRQIKLAMQQHSRRTQSTDSHIKKLSNVKNIKPIGQSSRPCTWHMQTQVINKIKSSSDSSRTSSPVFKKINKKRDNSLTKVNIINSNGKTETSISKSNNLMELNKNGTVRPSISKIEKTRKEPIQSSILLTNKNTLQQKNKPRNSIILKNNKKVISEINGASKTVLVKKKNTNNKPSVSGSSSSTQQSPLLTNKRKITISSNTSSTPNSQDPYSGSPSLRRSLLLAAKAPQVPVKQMSPTINNITRIKVNNSITSPTKSSAAKCVDNVNRTKNMKQSVSTKTVTTKSIANKTFKKITVGRSGTFLKDQPTVLNKTST